MTNTGSNLQGINGNQYGGTLNVSASPMNNGQWHLITMVNYLDGATWRTRVYYDDGTSFTTFNTGAGGITPGLMRVGDTTRGGNSWNGQIDDLRIYRRALTQPEIAALYNPPPAPTFATWLAGLDNPPPAHLRDPDEDPDGDGLQNVLEFLLGGDPASHSARRIPHSAGPATISVISSAAIPPRGVGVSPSKPARTSMIGKRSPLPTMVRHPPAPASKARSREHRRP